MGVKAKFMETGVVEASISLVKGKFTFLKMICYSRNLAGTDILDNCITRELNIL